MRPHLEIKIWADGLYYSREIEMASGDPEAAKAMFERLTDMASLDVMDEPRAGETRVDMLANLATAVASVQRSVDSLKGSMRALEKRQTQQGSEIGEALERVGEVENNVILEAKRTDREVKRLETDLGRKCDMEWGLDHVNKGLTAMDAAIRRLESQSKHQDARLDGLCSSDEALELALEKVAKREANQAVVDQVQANREKHSALEDRLKTAFAMIKPLQREATESKIRLAQVAAESQQAEAKILKDLNTWMDNQASATRNWLYGLEAKLEATAREVKDRALRQVNEAVEKTNKITARIAEAWTKAQETPSGPRGEPVRHTNAPEDPPVPEKPYEPPITASTTVLDKAEDQVSVATLMAEMDEWKALSPFERAQRGESLKAQRKAAGFKLGEVPYDPTLVGAIEAGEAFDPIVVLGLVAIYDQAETIVEEVLSYPLETVSLPMADMSPEPSITVQDNPDGDGDGWIIQQVGDARLTMDDLKAIAGRSWRTGQSSSPSQVVALVLGALRKVLPEDWGPTEERELVDWVRTIKLVEYQDAADKPGPEEAEE